MKNVFILLILAVCSAVNAQIINFPDDHFKFVLVNTLCVDTNGDYEGDADADSNNDGEIDVSEALQVIYLHITNSQISILDGIEYFKNLSILECGYNQLTSLNVQGLTNLTTLGCYSNQLTSLNVQGLTNLTTLGCYSNQLTSLNVQGLIKLAYLNCRYNLLTSINIQGLGNLSILECANNQLTSLNVQGLTNLTTLTCFSNQLTSLNVQGLTNLTGLSCDNNQLTSINIQGLTILTRLTCGSNLLTSLNVEGLTNLTFLTCDFNQLTTLNVQGLTKLTNLKCSLNHLTALNVEGLNNLTTLSCYSNQLTTLNVKGLTNLKTLDSHSNQLTSLNLQGLTKLRSLNCYSNQLTSLNLQGLTNLEFLLCHANQLTSLNIKGTKLFQGLSFVGNLLLSYICCDEVRINEIKNKAISNGLLHCEVNSYCSFTPGGKFYILKGKNIYDIDNNGCDDLDIKPANTKYYITNDSIVGTFIANITGNYQIPLQEGNYNITPILVDPQAFIVTPSSIQVTFPSTSDTIIRDFCIIPKGISRKIHITLLPLAPPARPGFEASYKIVWENVGNQIESGTLNFTYDEALLDYISATQTPDQVAEGIVKWNFTKLLPFEKREITVNIKINRPTDTPPVNVGDKLYLSASILDNIFTLENTVVGSLDPNDKTCLQGDRVKPDMVGEYVDYLIRFENTGNYAAENVVIKDIIDTKRFDVSTLQITDASHEVYARIEGNKVEFIFENIQLPFDDANNDGYIAFKIKTLPTLVLGDSLKNLADIYFDYNFPIRTNEAKTTIASSVATVDLDNDIIIYPNPVRDILHISTDISWSRADIYDISGRILQSVALKTNSMDVGNLKSGTYIVLLRNGNKVDNVKFVKL